MHRQQRERSSAQAEMEEEAEEAAREEINLPTVKRQGKQHGVKRWKRQRQLGPRLSGPPCA
jgi:hypothetical protein